MRKTKDVTIQKEGRDCGRVFKLTELDSWNAFIIAAKIAHALQQSGVNLPQIARTPEGVAEAGLDLLLFVKPEIGIPLLEELRECIQVYRPKSKPNEPALPLSGPNMPHEAGTWLTLYRELFYLHLGFSPAASSPISG